MKLPTFMAPRRLVLRKPPHGAPCTQCGLCCLAALCELGRGVFGQDQAPPCPALRFDAQENSFCDLAANPERYRTLARTAPNSMRLAALYLIRAGDGCDACFDNERRNAEFVAQSDAKDDPDETKQAKCLWNI